jgi:hypothetical protein
LGRMFAPQKKIPSQSVQRTLLEPFFAKVAIFWGKKSQKLPNLDNKFLEVHTTKRDPKKILLCWLTSTQNWLFLSLMNPQSTYLTKLKKRASKAYRSFFFNISCSILDTNTQLSTLWKIQIGPVIKAFLETIKYLRAKSMSARNTHLVWVYDMDPRWTFFPHYPHDPPRFFIILDNFLITIMESRRQWNFMNDTCRSGEHLNGCVEQCGALIIKYSRANIVDCQLGGLLGMVFQVIHCLPNHWTCFYYCFHALVKIFWLAWQNLIQANFNMLL